MAFWFYRGLRRGIVTTRYPKQVDPWTAGLPTPPAFHSARLTPELVDRLVEGCGADALWREDHDLVVDLGRCTGCGRCVELGEGVVGTSGVFLLAAAERSALIKRVPIGGEDGRRDGGR
jgi:hypothetical protein